MKVIIQRSKYSQVLVNKNIVGNINNGFVILVGFNINDTMDDINYIVNKILKLRVFDDDKGIMNLSIKDIDGEILSISQFTLYANTKEGNRPSYSYAMKSDKAKELYDIFNELLRKENINVNTGIFGENMEVSITNDGPVTIIIDSKDK
jgi:D-tyrosyl-tRNA(Tyr) deacylase